MDFRMNYLSFFVIQSESDKGSVGSYKAFKHYQTMDGDEYADSALKEFLDEEFIKIVKRKVERHPNTPNAPTKVGMFMVEPGYELGSNGNYNLFQRIREADHKERFHSLTDELVRVYMDTSAVRGGAFIVASCTLNTFFDEPFLFILKCDFEPKIARISDERSLIAQVEMAFSARSIKSIQYPHMEQEGILERWELKIHQASHARYFEDFLKYVSYEKPIPEVVSEQVVEMVHQYIEEKWQDNVSSERSQEENAVEVWAASEKRELQEWWTPQQVEEANYSLIQQKEDLTMAFKVGNVSIKGLLADYGVSVHIAKHNGRYVAVIEGDALQFEKGMSPVELLAPPPLEDIMEIIGTKVSDTADGTDSFDTANENVQPVETNDDTPPW
ncbi:DUF3900 domain-containing protein [Paenibacillus endoradicis]|uniref:DUF3900 domain-containing protein n=1 Tax=Paenibacillus endoradicis TaxID=2972487 RepID=UPI002159A8B2|nr:DUF3900 domain-containing protein [Paenibacillus endoradicis]MCR8656382.1 DUF3900 domain-containing protein [Paenibacillus endoradicis]